MLETCFLTNSSWDKLLESEYEKDYIKSLYNFITNEYNLKIIYPKKNDIFKALKLTSYENTKVVLIGQDPYHEKGQANGLCFSVNEGIKLPKSLQNIYKELKDDLDIDNFITGDLTKWAKQGVLLLNTCLTVEEHKPLSHKNKGWEIFTDRIISLLNERTSPVIFVLWGNDAKTKINLITNPIHYILKASHPSPLSAYRGFFGCKHFSKINEILKNNNQKEIDWRL